MTIKNLLASNKNAIWIALLWTFLILYLSLKNTVNAPKFSFPNADKVVHFTFYFVFVILWYRYLLLRKKVVPKTKMALIFLSIIFGIAIEFAQGNLTTTRHADIWDVVANSTGTLVGIFVATKLFKENKSSESFGK